jgi:hypothetical protein
LYLPEIKSLENFIYVPGTKRTFGMASLLLEENANLGRKEKPHLDIIQAQSVQLS